MRLAICAVFSLVVHVAFERGLELLPELDPSQPELRTIEVRVIEPPPPVVVPPPPVVEPPPIVPPAAVPAKAAPAKAAEPSAPPPTQVPHVAATAPETATPDPAALKSDATDDQVFNGGDLSSSSGGGGHGSGTGGNGHGSGGGAIIPAAKPSTGSEPIGAFEATKMPLPQGRCFGKYTPEATAAGTEGTVTLDLIVGEDGRVRDIVATDKLPNGLTESAIAALRDCRFTPGEKDGHAVPVRIRGFKIHFVLQTAGP